jgi:hypothetical protein
MRSHSSWFRLLFGDPNLSVERIFFARCGRKCQDHVYISIHRRHIHYHLLLRLPPSGAPFFFPPRRTTRRELFSARQAYSPSGTQFTVRPSISPSLTMHLTLKSRGAAAGSFAPDALLVRFPDKFGKPWLWRLEGAARHPSVHPSITSRNNSHARLNGDDGSLARFAEVCFRLQRADGGPAAPFP